MFGRLALTEILTFPFALRNGKSNIRVLQGHLSGSLTALKISALCKNSQWQSTLEAATPLLMALSHKSLMSSQILASHSFSRILVLYLKAL